MKPGFACLLAAIALLGTASAQDQATTLASASQRADVIVVATVTAATDPSPEWHRLQWRTNLVLDGQIGSSFALIERAGACCGRSLFALGAGDQRLLFLQRTGPRLHPLGGARGVAPAVAGVVSHVQALLAAPTAAARAKLLAARLADPEPRIAHDAAHALASMPELTLDATDRGRVAAALQLAIARGQTTAASLIEAASRCADPALIDGIVPLYLTVKRADRARLLRRGLARVRPELLADRLAMHAGNDRARQLRAAELLRKLPGHRAQSAMHDLLHQTTCPRVKLCLSEGLIAAGTRAVTLESTVPPAVLELAQRRVTAARFRSVQPTAR